MIAQERSYRKIMARTGLVSFRVRHMQTDLHVQASFDLTDLVSAWIIQARLVIESYAENHPGFLEALTPWPEDELAPSPVREMIAAATEVGVGPMAAVAGAISEYVGIRCRDVSDGEVIVENGGDIFLWTNSSVDIALWAGDSPLSGKVGIELSGDSMPLGVCTSSGTVGHSLSLGKADAVTVISADCALADAAATAAGNMVKSPEDIEPTIDFLRTLPSIIGVVVIIGDKLGVWGDIKLTPM